MTTVNVYLHFDGRCEEAFNFYRSAFGGEFSYMSRFGEMPPSDGIAIAEADSSRIMHISLPISKETVLMGCDVRSALSPNFRMGNNFNLSIYTDSREKADRLFNTLSAGGMVSMPMADMFWGEYYGMFTDKFGVNWMVSYADPNRTKG